MLPKEHDVHKYEHISFYKVRRMISLIGDQRGAVLHYVYRCLLKSRMSRRVVMCPLFTSGEDNNPLITTEGAQGLATLFASGYVMMS